MEEIKDILARNSRLTRHALKISQEDLADLSGLDRTYVSGIERGVRNPTISVVARLAKALGLTVSELLDAQRFKSRSD